MSFSPSTLAELKTELETLQNLKSRIDERVRSLEAILQPLDLGRAALPFMSPTNGTKASAAVVAAPVRQEDEPQKPNATNGLRAAIREALKMHGPRRAPEVAKMLLEQGFPNDSSTPLSTRVYNDLWRMGEKGLVQNNGGVFSLT